MLSRSLSFAHFVQTGLLMDLLANLSKTVLNTDVVRQERRGEEQRKRE